MGQEIEKYVPKYLEKLKVSRGPRQPGEIFALKFRGVGYYYGRVIRNACAIAPSLDAPIRGPWRTQEGIYLVYIYKFCQQDLEPLPKLRLKDLLLPPLMIIGAGWTHGYFLPVGNEPLTSTNAFPQHCFARRAAGKTGKSVTWYIDELGHRLPRRRRMCGTNAIHSFGSLETEITKALGLHQR